VVLSVPGLFSNKHHVCVRWSFAENPSSLPLASLLALTLTA
jgi:hypothetical protein